MGLTDRGVQRVLEWLFSHDFWVSMHTADPGQGSQITNEAEYLDYRRVLVPGGEWNVSGRSAANAELWAFPKSKSEVIITHLGLGEHEAGPGALYMLSALQSPLRVFPGHVPMFPGGNFVYRLVSHVEKAQASDPD